MIKISKNGNNVFFDRQADLEVHRWQAAHVCFLIIKTSFSNF